MDKVIDKDGNIWLANGSKIFYKDMLELCQNYKPVQNPTSVFPTVVDWELSPTTSDIPTFTENKSPRLNSIIDKLEGYLKGVKGK